MKKKCYLSALTLTLLTLFCSDSNAVSCVPHCKTCDSSGKCTKCNDGYALADLGSDAENPQCYPADYILADGTKVTQPMVQEDRYCQEVGQQWKRKTYHHNEKRVTIECIESLCAQSGTTEKGYRCIKCDPGYAIFPYYTFWPGCVPANYVLADGTKVTQPMVEEEAYCQQVGQKVGYKSVGSKSATIYCADINCADFYKKLNYPEAYCRSCNPGYALSENKGTCLPADYILADGTKVNQPMVDEQQYCLNVNETWIETQYSSTRATLYCRDRKCTDGKISSSGQYICTECTSGYILKDNRCQKQTDTVNGPCPDGLSKSTDGCCCLE